MKPVKIIVIMTAMSLVAGCGGIQDKTRDGGLGKHKSLSTLKAGIWVDPNGCDHWIIDDGLEGYLSQRLDEFGKPVCSDTSIPSTATGL